MGSTDGHAVQQMQVLGQLLEAEMGWSVSAANDRFLGHALDTMARARQFGSAAECAGWLTEGAWTADKAACCAQYLTIGETYFFRERRGFDLVVECAQRRLADPLRAGRPLRIWSAGCCTGEEPYSAAMALRAAMPQLGAGAVTILATDISKHNLDAARAGVYRKWSFRRSADPLVERFFEPAGGELRVRGDIRAMVTFAELNLALPVYPSAANGTAGLDVILCRNVLMYFTVEQRRKVIQRFRACLADGGWLVVSPSEASADLFEGFAATSYPDAIHYQKRERGAAPVAALPVAALAPQPAAPKARRAPVRRPPPVTAAPEREPAASAEPSDAIDAIRPQVLRLLEAGEADKARRCLQQILFLAPVDIAGHYLMGVALDQLGRPELARRRFEVAAQLLAAVADDAIVAGTDGLPAGYLRNAIGALLAREAQR
mgnify:CR=1 FL=1